MAKGASVTRVWELDLKAAEMTGQRGVFTGLAVLAEGGDAAHLCARFKELTKVTVNIRELRQIAHLNTKQVAKQVQKRKFKERYARQFRQAPGSSSVRTVSGGLPTLGQR
ncbi:hypothetical protein [Cellulomonas chengniuliangii]|uniref:Uncharacterized protein n=1 Tax=Cellulomonas chengniuliangii TaxID=2968084 RepID=A0ABY5KTP3_9CELL|nr:hypothetical protein [Cellulomonas chengniuliangii]MCC2308528.1 hypothetical protein [Cellulomonas chengniuliangii]MCC2317545.1 hypothetical protein [Cellulomonas chengniuliangii]UUI73892.1 hypothetical protein NP064_08515 [Cellulomonas chengniuliangii]